MLTGGFYPTGYIHAVDKGDLNNDTNVDFALLSRTANLSTGNTSVPGAGTGAAFRIASYDSATGISLSSWVPTCTNATRVMMADVNGDYTMTSWATLPLTTNSAFTLPTLRAVDLSPK